MKRNICKLHHPICKGSCCEDTAVVATRKRPPYYPAMIKREMPQLTLTGFTTHIHLDGKRCSGFLFSCSNFDKTSRLCKDFANRPYMCHIYICREAVNILALTDEPIEDLPW